MKKLLQTLLILCVIMFVVACEDETPEEIPYTYTSNEATSIFDSNIEPAIIQMPEWMDDSTMYEVNVRQYTESGTFEAFQDELPRLKDLGVEILWFMPIHEISLTNRNGTLGSYYAISDYTSINHEFGNKTDFHNLVDRAKSMGFKIVMDIVFNHTGWDSPWITEHPEYYFQEGGEIVHPRGTNWTDVAELDTSRSDVIDALGDVLYYWVDEFEIDGFRCDFASGVENSTWETLRDRVDDLDPDIFFLAEDNTKTDWFDTFNANYGGWTLLGNLSSIYSGSNDKNDLINYLNQSNSMYPNGTFPLNFVTNHDMNSWDGTIEERLGDSADLMTMLTFTLPGMPLIYSGQEASTEKMLEFFEKDLISWGNYGNTDFLTSLVSLKKDHPALFNTNFSNSMDILYNENDMLLSFVRYDQDLNDFVLVIANLSDDMISDTIHMNTYMGKWTNAVTGYEDNLQEFQTLNVLPYSYMIFTR